MRSSASRLRVQESYLLAFGRAPWMGYLPEAGPSPLQDNTNRNNAYDHAPNWIRTHDPSV
jgi:hypothetical protein